MSGSNQIRCSQGIADLGDIQAYKSCTLLDGYPCSTCQSALELAAQIKETKITLDALFRQQRNLHKIINDSHAFINRLPIELHSYNFELSLPKEWHSLEERRDLKKTDMSAPLILGAVCQIWRQAAWTSPRLWTCIYLVYDFDITELKPSLHRITYDWLSRAGQLLLSISIYPDQEKWTEDPKPDQITSITRALTPFVHLVNVYSHRWKHLDIHVPNKLMPYLTGTSSGPPILEKLRILNTNGNEDTTPVDRLLSMTGIKPAPTYIHSAFYSPLEQGHQHIGRSLLYLQMPRCPSICPPLGTL